MPNLFISSHPLVLHKLTKLRSNKTEPKKFRELVREISGLLAYEATADLAIRPCSVQTPRPKQMVLIYRRKLVWFRSYAGWVWWKVCGSIAFREVWHIGIYRDEQTLKPVEYYNKLPTEPTVSVCLILIPCWRLVVRQSPPWMFSSVGG